MKCKEYISFDTKDKLLEYLSESSAVIVSGATAIIPKAHNCEWYENEVMVDISKIDELRGITTDGKEIVIGAGTTIGEIMKNEIISEYAPMLKEACSHMGGVQLRNRATIGGNIANACIAADTIVPLALMNAEVNTNLRTYPITGLIKSCQACLSHRACNTRQCFYGKTSGKKTVLSDNEVILSISFTTEYKNVKYGYERISARNAMDMSDLTVAAMRKDSRYRVCLGAVLPEFRLFCNDDAKALVTDVENAIDSELKNCEWRAYKKRAAAKILADMLEQLGGGDSK